MTADAAAPHAMPSRWRRARVIWNSGAGSKAGVPTNSVSEEQLRELLARAGVGDELRTSDSADDAAALAAAAVRDGYELVVAAGGDGTIGTIADELLDSQTALGILPLGSVMNVARSIGLPRELDAAADVLRTGVVRPIDVGEVAGRPFYEAGSVGLNAAVFAEAQRVDEGNWASVARTVWVALRYRPARMIIQLDDRQLRTRALMVSVANGPYTGLGFTVAPGASMDDGQFDVVVFRRFSKLQLFRHALSIAFGRRRYTPEVEVYRSRRVRIESVHPLPSRADSRDLGSTPVEFAVRPSALRVVVPADGGDGSGLSR
jgi:diacylglycerol kinase (ATP)